MEITKKEHFFTGSQQLVINPEALELIFGNPEVRDKPVAIYSVAGAYRKGKSFILNLFRRYLLFRLRGEVRNAPENFTMKKSDICTFVFLYPSLVGKMLLIFGSKYMHLK